ncbi:S8 family peptidase [Paenibacillus massiliensis]|uniref:S8 family peptidase n=1 Tax=Paenibacillus massiliensis TaxID=225917 RepID=UPI000472C1D7|nr:S8 family peptidase [Paenibacillus massiliensis]
MEVYSMLQLVRQHAKQLDKDLRNQILELYRTLFRWTPCVLHTALERFLKKTQTYSVIIEFEDQVDSYADMVSFTHQTARQYYGCRVKYKFPAISSCAADITLQGIEELLSSGYQIKKVHADREFKALLNVATPSVHADWLHEEGLTGKEVTIAILDTGIYPHEDLTEPENRIVAFQDMVNHKAAPYDDNGHGTHCAGDAAGNGRASGGVYAGPAPEAKLVGVKVLDKRGSGRLSTVIAGVQWCIDHKEKYSIDILSMSLGSRAVSRAADDPVVKIVEKAWDSGMVVCVAAGNEGPEERTISSPGISSRVITVGAMNDNNTVDRGDDVPSDFSSRGPTMDQLMKPDLLAPGTDIVSLRSPGSYLDKLYKSSRIGSDYTTMSGTSMATPICAGAIALLLERFRGATPDEIKRRLLEGCEDRKLPEYIQGRGYLDVRRSAQSKN